MSKLFIFIAILSVIVSCVSEENVRLQTDQSFEGNELYEVSKILDEHVPLILQRSSFFSSDASTSLIDCPTLQIIGEGRGVQLSYGAPICEEIPSKRNGIIRLMYSRPQLLVGDSVTVTFQDYSFDGFSISGTRVLHLVALHRDRRVFEERNSQLLIVSLSDHSTMIQPGYTYEVFEIGGNIVRVNSNGLATGRNRGGRQFSAEVSEGKVFEGACLTKQVPRPVSGLESWTISRTSSRNVVHKLRFFNEGECTTHTTVTLDEGVEMRKTP